MVCGVGVYRELEGILLTGVRVNLDRDKETAEEELTQKMVGGEDRASSPLVFISVIARGGRSVEWLVVGLQRLK